VPGPPIPLALVLTSFDPGGTEHQMTELARRIDPAKFDVHVACLKDQGALRARVADRFTIAEFPLRSFVSADAERQLLRFAAWCRRSRIQIVHACDFYSNVLALPGAWLARVPVRLGSRRDVMMPERSRAQAWLQTFSYRFAHRVVANSSAAAEQLRAEAVAAGKILRIANGLDLDQTPRMRTNPGPVVRTVANLRPGKGHEILIDAAVEVARRYPDVTFSIVGDGSRRAELERYADAGGVGHVIRFEGHRSDVGELLASSDVFAFPSFMEASPNAVLEAMAAALPIVATNVGGIPEVISDGQSGLLVPPGDAHSLAAAIIELLGDRSKASRLGAAARAIVEARFGFDRMVGDFEALYCEELSRRATGAMQACPVVPGS
jgi:glycosyltransferase involved in cell wall biosynthesis